MDWCFGEKIMAIFWIKFDDRMLVCVLGVAGHSTISHAGIFSQPSTLFCELYTFGTADAAFHNKIFQ